MTDRLKGLVVAFETDIREDDAQCIIDAILMIKGVCGVSMHVSNPDDYMNRMLIKQEVRDKLLQLYKDL